MCSWLGRLLQSLRSHVSSTFSKSLPSSRSQKSLLFRCWMAKETMTMAHLFLNYAGLKVTFLHIPTVRTNHIAYKGKGDGKCSRCWTTTAQYHLHTAWGPKIVQLGVSATHIICISCQHSLHLKI